MMVWRQSFRAPQYNGTNQVAGPAGKLLDLLDRHPYRPAHIHLIVSKNMVLLELY